MYDFLHQWHFITWYMPAITTTHYNSILAQIKIVVDAIQF